MILDGRQAGFARQAGIGLDVRRQVVGQFDQAIGGAGRAGGQQVGLMRFAFLMAETQPQAPGAAQLDDVFDGDRTGYVAEVLVVLLVPVVLVVQGQVQFVVFEMAADQFHRRAVGLVVVEAAFGALAVAGIGEHVQAVLVLVGVQAGLQGQRVAQFSRAYEVQAFLVPEGPLPVTHAALRGFTGVHRIALFAFLLAVGQGVFIAGVGGEADLQRGLAVGAIGVLPAVATVGRRSLVVLEAAAQGKAVRVQIGGAGLEVPQALVGADTGGDLALAAGGEADTHVAFQLA